MWSSQVLVASSVEPSQSRMLDLTVPRSPEMVLINGSKAASSMVCTSLLFWESLQPAQLWDLFTPGQTDRFVWHIKAYKSKWGIVGTRDYRVKLFLISCVEAIREGDGKKNSQEEVQDILGQVGRGHLV